MGGGGGEDAEGEGRREAVRRRREGRERKRVGSGGSSAGARFLQRLYPHRAGWSSSCPIRMVAISENPSTSSVTC